MINPGDLIFFIFNGKDAYDVIVIVDTSNNTNVIMNLSIKFGLRHQSADGVNTRIARSKVTWSAQ